VVADITAEGLAVMVRDPKFKPGEDQTEADAPLIPLVENKKIMQPFGDRSKVVIEPMLTDQWFCDAETLAKPALEAVADGRTNFVPENWKKTYDNWLNEIEPWCISRQLWWGHRIPVWYGPRIVGSEDMSDYTEWAKTAELDYSKPVVFCADNRSEAIKLAHDYYRKKYANWNAVSDGFTLAEILERESDPSTRALEVKEIPMYQDEDVLDTWFSSALWPFSTQGWPEETDAPKTFYPGAVLVTAFDIIFFWVARMMMMGMKFMTDENGAPEVPFKDVYIHAIVRDENGKKMSKSEGNVIDPVDLIDGIGIDDLVAKRTTGLRQPEKAPKVEKETRKKYPKGFDAYGADALRFTLAAMATKGRDINLSVDRVAGYRNFGTKLWNATRFAQMNEAVFGGVIAPEVLTSPINRWIVGELYKASAAITEAIEDYRFNDAAGAAYHFVWDIVCDWYLELSKPVLQSEEESALKTETRQTLGWTLDQIFKLLHPFMPFITEALWEQTADGSARETEFAMQAQWPGLRGGWSDASASEELDWVLRTISAIRSVRSDVNVPAGAKVPASFVGASEGTAARVERHRDVICRMARLDKLDVVDIAAPGSVKTVIDEATLVLEIADLIDRDAEVERLEKQLGKLGGEITGLEKRLGNEAFVAKAPPEVVAEQRARLSSLGQTREKLSAARDQLIAL
ncbi:MAG: class I tRNA ligase family protein, partial [Pseudomonadota bacterium]